VDLGEAADDHAERGEAGEVQRDALDLCVAPERATRLPHQGEGAPEQQPRGPGVGAVVGPARVHRRLEQVGHPQQRGDRACADDAGDRQVAALEQPQQAEQEDRPQQVELLLDRQRPQVLEHRWTLDEGEVRLLGEDQEPVRDVEEGRPDLPGQVRRILAVEDQHDHRDRRQQRVEGRQQTPGPAEPEALQRDLRRPAVLLGEQQGDQVPADDEEHLDPEEPAVQPLHVGVVEEHGDDGHRAQAVEPGQVGGGSPGRVRPLLVP
jgi:hypothetical protein